MLGKPYPAEIKVTLTGLETPVKKSGADTTVCVGETINTALLLGMIDYDEAEETIEFYTNPACTTPFTSTTANIASSPYTYYVIARKTTGCSTPASKALVLKIVVLPNATIDMIIISE